MINTISPELWERAEQLNGWNKEGQIKDSDKNWWSYKNYLKQQEDKQ